MSASNSFWHIDFASPYQAYMYGIKKHIYCGNTKFQQVDIIDTFTFGLTLVLDGKIQSSELDEFIYHEALVHPPMILHPAPKNVLIIGGGEGAVTRELLRYPTVEKIVMVDLDEEVVNLCRNYLPSWHQGSFDDKKLELLHMDARAYLEKTDRKFDVIISDLTEPVDDGPSYLLFTREFYELVNERLTPGGVITVQAGSFSLALLDAHAAVRNTLKTAFDLVQSYHIYIPSFDSSWGFIMASKNRDLLRVDDAEIDQRIKNMSSGLRFYDGETHQTMFSVPRYLRKALDEEKRIITDGSPLIIY